MPQRRLLPLAFTVLSSGVLLFLGSASARAQARGHSTDPFVAVERESQEARHAESRERQEAAETMSERTRERGLTRLSVDEDADELEDTAGDE